MTTGPIWSAITKPLGSYTTGWGTTRTMQRQAGRDLALRGLTRSLLDR